ncbi:hypothetical protein D3C72_486130 [compost metagenome]
MGDAAGHVAPGGVTLGGHQTGDVVEGQHHLAALPAFDTHPQAPRLAVAADVNVLFDMSLGALGQLGQFRCDLAQKASLNVRLTDCQQLTGAVVDGRDTPHPVQADNPGADARQHGLDEAAAPLGVVAGGLQRRLLGHDVAGHPVEGLGQDDQFAGRSGIVDTRVQVAAGHLIRSLHQTANRGRYRTGRRHGQPDGADQNQQRCFQIAEGEGCLNPRSAFFCGAVGGDGFLAVAHSLDQTGRERADDVEIGVTVVRQRIEGPHHVGVLGHGRRRDLAGGHRLERFARRRDIGGRAGLLAAGQHFAVAVQDIEGRIAEEVADLSQSARELDAVVEQAAYPAQFGGHGFQIHLQPRAHVRDIGPTDLCAVFDRRTYIGAEPLIHAAIDQDAEDKRDQNRRNDRHQRKQSDETKMQARAWIISVPHQAHHSHADDRRQTANQHQIG